MTVQIKEPYLKVNYKYSVILYSVNAKSMLYHHRSYWRLRNTETCFRKLTFRHVYINLIKVLFFYLHIYNNFICEFKSIFEYETYNYLILQSLIYACRLSIAEILKLLSHPVKYTSLIICIRSVNENYLMTYSRMPKCKGTTRNEGGKTRDLEHEL